MKGNNVYNGVRLTSTGIKVYDEQLWQDMFMFLAQNAFIIFQDVKYDTQLRRKTIPPKSINTLITVQSLWLNLLRFLIICCS